jgi:hypothetical protein
MASASVFGSGHTSIYQIAEGCRFESGLSRFLLFSSNFLTFYRVNVSRFVSLTDGIEKERKDLYVAC